MSYFMVPCVFHKTHKTENDLFMTFSPPNLFSSHSKFFPTKFYKPSFLLYTLFMTESKKPVPVIPVNMPSVQDKVVEMRQNFRSFNTEVALSIITQIAEGQSLNFICSQPGMPTMFEIQIWKKKSPDFRLYMQSAIKMRAEKKKEDLVDLMGVLKKSIIGHKGKIDEKMVDRYMKVIERVTTIDDPDQNVKSGASVNVNINKNEAPKFIISNPYAGKGKEVDMDALRVDRQGEDDDGQFSI